MSKVHQPPKQPPFAVGQYVRVTNRSLRGHIAYIGETSFSSGLWIGLVLDEAKGRNNGSVRGTKYFSCAPNHGLFVRPAQLTVSASMSDSVAESPKAAAAAARKEAPVEKQQMQVEKIEATLEPLKAETAEAVAKTNEIAATTPSNGGGAKGRKLSSGSTTSSGSGSMLRTTKINQPMPAKQQFSSSSSHLSGAKEALPLSLVAGSSVVVAPPKRSKTMVSPSETFCRAGKQASFVETGFLEILRPQFFPGQRLRSPTFTANASGFTSASSLVASAEPDDQRRHIKELERHIADLTDELAALGKQKAADKLKLQEYEKFKIQNEQLTEFKAKIMEQHSALLRDLQRSRQESRDYGDTVAKCKREITEMAESLEFLTLDKEMAEERVETLLLELEVAHEHIEELTLDVDILRAEYESHAAADHQNTVASGNAEIGVKNENTLPTLGEWRKMEQYNHRLRETVVRLRDLLAEEKQHLQKATKELETKQSEINELHNIKELLSQRVEILEMHIVDLKEQVDASLGAESVVATLASAKLELEERVKLLEEEVAELEALEEIQEQLIESNQELEVDLRDEIDMLNGSLKSSQMEKDQALDTIYDRDLTIQKFRDLVKGLMAQLQVRQTTSATAATLSPSEDCSSAANLSHVDELPQTTTVDFNHMFSVTKAYGRAIDGQLGEVEAKLLRMHVEYLLTFLPEDFLLRGGEYDVILIMILLRRLIEKLDIICRAMREKFPGSCEFGKDAIFEGFSVHRFAFRSKCMFYLLSLKLVVQQFVYAFDHSEFELCSHLSIYRLEMESQERHVDDMLALLKNGMLDENSRTDGIEAAASFFMSLHMTLMPPKEFGELINEHDLYVTLLEVLETALHCIHTQASLLHTIIRLEDEQTESYSSMQCLMDQTTTFKVTLKKLHHKLSSSLGDTLREANGGVGMSSQALCHGLPHEGMLQIQTTIDYVGRLINILSATAKEVTKDIFSSRTDSYSDDCTDMSIGHNKLWHILTVQCEKLGPPDRGMPASLLTRSVQLVADQIQEFFKFIALREAEKSTNVNTVFARSASKTLAQRAAAVRQHYEDVKTLRQCIVERDKEIKTLKYVAQMKQNDFSEMQIRKEMAERSLGRILHDQEHAIQTIAAYIDNVENEIRSKDVAFAHALADLAGKLGRLEATVQRLHVSLNTNSQLVHIEESVAHGEITVLKRWLHERTAECERLKAAEMRRKLRRLTPIQVPRRPDVRLQRLHGELQRVHNDWILSHIVWRPQEAQAALQTRAQRVTAQIFDTYYGEHPHRVIATRFGRFPTADVRRLFSNAAPQAGDKEPV